MLEEHGQNIARFRPLVYYSPFAIQFRYADEEEIPEELDREGTIKAVQELFELVEDLIPKP